jgi:hypothetical protein
LADDNWFGHTREEIFSFLRTDQMIGAEAIQVRPAVVVDDGSTDLMTNGFVVDFGRKRRESRIPFVERGSLGSRQVSETPKNFDPAVFGTSGNIAATLPNALGSRWRPAAV